VTENELMVATRMAADRIATKRVCHLGEMGSTVVAMRITREHAVIAHVGDSRVYRLRDGKLAQLTVDHSLLAQLIANGTPPADAAQFPFRHVVTRALGTQSAEPEVQREKIRPGDVYLLCSDGLSEVLEPEHMAMMLEQPPEQACRALVDAAYVAGSRDNISAIVVRCE
jgi:serine/threonine protein phosphatase PrpC